MSAHQTPQKVIFALCLLSLSLSAIACSSNSQVLTNTEPSKKTITNKNTVVAASVPTKEDKAIPKYAHIFVIIEENKSSNQIIGNSNAPIINQLAKTYGFASNFYAEVHPSEANYVAILGGSTFGIHDDDAFYCQVGSTDKFCHNSQKSDYVSHTVTSKSLIDQL
jgi:phosphatidylinositol-3-phosphatase